MTNNTPASEVPRRELKFRAWDSGEGRMWSHAEIDASDKDGIVLWGELFRNKEGGFTLMQFTGLKDKNGKEIYEGDIVRAVPVSGWVDYVHFNGPKDSIPLWVVRWDWDGFCWESLCNDKRYVDERSVNTTEKDTYFHEGVLLQEKEVVGNIYETPELLEAK